MASSNSIDLPAYRTLQRAYKTLGLSPSATPSEIRNAFKTLAVRVHPDKVPASECEHATTQFQKLKAAYDICLPHAETLADSKKVTCDDDPDSEPSSAPSFSPNDPFFMDLLRELHAGEAPLAPAAARKREKLYGDMVEEVEVLTINHAWRGPGSNSQARWTAEQKLAQHQKAYAANGKLDEDIRKALLTAEQWHKVKRAREKRAKLEEAVKEEKEEIAERKRIEQALRKAEREVTKQVEVEVKVKRLKEVPENWEDEMEDEEEGKVP